MSVLYLFSARIHKLACETAQEELELIKQQLEALKVFSTTNSGLSISAADRQYRRLFEHFYWLVIGGDIGRKQQSLQKCFKKKTDEIKRSKVKYFQNISANFKSYLRL